MVKILQIIYKGYKRIRPPKRLYKYGTTGLKYFDDRSLKEKVFDYIDEFFFNLEQKIRYAKAYRKAIFNSYFDFGLGKVISSTEEIRKKEKQGYAYTTFSQMEAESDRVRARIKKEQKERTKKYFHEGIKRIRSGNSNYYQQLLEKQRKNS